MDPTIILLIALVAAGIFIFVRRRGGRIKGNLAKSEERLPNKTAKTRLPGYLESRTFSVPATPEEFLTVLFSSVNSFGGKRQFAHYKDQYDVCIAAGIDPATPQLVESIYISSLTSEGLTLTAGNRVATFWTISITLTGSLPTVGEVLGTIPDASNTKWSGSIIEIQADIASSVRSVGGSTGDWPLTN